MDCIASFREDGDGEDTARVGLKGKRFADENAMPCVGILSRVARDAMTMAYCSAGSGKCYVSGKKCNRMRGQL